jgi:CRISPR-associated protein Cas5d
MLERGGRRDIFLGTRECQGYIAPCEFGSGEGAYDDIPELSFGMMYHGMTYADEAWSEETKGHMTANFWFPTMKRGVIEFPRPEECPLHKTLREMEIKPFGKEYDNFSGLEEFEGVTEWD